MRLILLPAFLVLGCSSGTLSEPDATDRLELHWWDNGVYYRMHHENLHVTVDQLMDTAESMY